MSLRVPLFKRLPNSKSSNSKRLKMNKSDCKNNSRLSTNKSKKNCYSNSRDWQMSRNGSRMRKSKLVCFKKNKRKMKRIGWHAFSKKINCASNRFYKKSSWDSKRSKMKNKWDSRRSKMKNRCVKNNYKSNWNSKSSRTCWNNRSLTNSKLCLNSKK